LVARWLDANKRDRPYLLRTLEMSPFDHTRFQYLYLYEGLNLTRS
jgi:hypothetical protein